VNFANDYFEVSLLHHNVDAPFIHYEFGLPPDFIKVNYTFDDQIAILAAGGSPFDAILKNNPTSSTDFLQRVVQSYMKGRGLHRPQNLPD